jgi:uncharacterized protein YaaN involved in tellurite resistance
MGFSMEVLDVQAVKKEVIENSKPVAEEIAKLKDIADNNAAEIITADMESLEKRKEILQSIDSFGIETMQSSAQKSSMLQNTINSFSKMGEEGGTVSKGLLDLQRELKDLDPSMMDFTKTGILGAFFNPIKAYFAKYQRADVVIADIVTSLDKGKATLTNDNTTLEIEQEGMRVLTKKLTKEIELGSMMDSAISLQIEQAKAKNEDPEKVKFVTEEILFPLRQRIMDMQQMIIVNQQGIMAVEVVIRNNKELIRGVDRAKNVTISALKISAIVASALYNQRIVLKKIEMLNATTNDLISGTSRMLKEQGAEIHKQSMEANISVETLRASFADALSALDAISTYKQEALPRMKEQIDQFRELADKGEQQIRQLEQGHRLS